jgi:hypothetical protein
VERDTRLQGQELQDRVAALGGPELGFVPETSEGSENLRRFCWRRCDDRRGRHDRARRPRYLISPRDGRPSISQLLDDNLHCVEGHQSKKRARLRQASLAHRFGDPRLP